MCASEWVDGRRWRRSLAVGFRRTRSLWLARHSARRLGKCRTTFHDRQPVAPLELVLEPAPRDFSDGFKLGTEPEQLYLRVAAGIPPGMPPTSLEVIEELQSVKTPLTREEIWAVVYYVQTEFLDSR